MNNRTLLAITFACAFSLCGIAPSNAADLAGRDAAIARIMRSQLNTAMLAGSNLAAASTLASVRQTNPGVSKEELKEITDEVGELMASGMSQPGNPAFTAYRTLLEPMSDAELSELGRLLADPVYRKFSRALSSEASQRMLIKGMMENTPWMPEALNLVLRKRGLKEVH